MRLTVNPFRPGYIILVVLIAIIPHAHAIPLPNAWQVLDPSIASGSAHAYSVTLDAAQQLAATNSTGGFNFGIDARMVVSANSASKAMYMGYGLGSSRFLVWFDLDVANNLTAHVEGHGDVVVVGAGLGHAAYHTHEIVYDGASSTASYLFDGQEVVSNWTGNASAFTAGKISWGSGSSTGAGAMNFHQVEFQITNTVVATYDAGTENNPVTAPDPISQGWAESPGVVDTSVANISPDTGLLPAATTLPVSGLTLSGAQFNGTANAGGSPATAWFEWGTNTSYGNTTQPVDMGQGLATSNLAATAEEVVVGSGYHYRMVVSNAYSTVAGTDESFTFPFLPDISHGSVAWADYDLDGRMDLLLIGFTGTELISQLWKNTDGGFVEVSIPGLPGVNDGSVAWADYDNDGLPDFLLTGSSGPSGISQLWRNTGNGFVQVSIPGLPGVHTSSVAWADYDNDGRADFLITGYDDFGSPVSQLWWNTGSGFEQEPILGLAGVQYSSVAWADYNNDGFFDFLLTGGTGGGFDPISQLWKNTGIGFEQVPVPGLPDVFAGSVAWADYDNDGLLDFLLTGSDGSAAIGQLWRNTGSGFELIYIPGFAGGARSSVAWADYDNDGRSDFLFTAESMTGDVSQLWRNTGAGFEQASISGLPEVKSSSVAWADHNNDGRTDFVLTGDYGGSPVTFLWTNQSPAVTTAPTAPVPDVVTPLGYIAMLNWAPAVDAETPIAGLSYNLRVGITPGGSEILSPLALAGGTRLVPQIGNVGFRTDFPVSIVFGVTYYWSVQAVDGAFLGGPFSLEQSFTLSSLFPPDGNPVPGDADGDGEVSLAELNVVLGNYNGGVVDQSALDDVLALYWPYSPWLYMANVADLGTSAVNFSLTNSTAGAYSVEYTTNLVDWVELGPAIPRYEFIDTNAPVTPQRFYRLVWP